MLSLVRQPKLLQWLALLPGKATVLWVSVDIPLLLWSTIMLSLLSLWQERGQQIPGVCNSERGRKWREGDTTMCVWRQIAQVLSCVWVIVTVCAHFTHTQAKCLRECTIHAATEAEELSFCEQIWVRYGTKRWISSYGLNTRVSVLTTVMESEVSDSRDAKVALNVKRTSGIRKIYPWCLLDWKLSAPPLCLTPVICSYLTERLFSHLRLFMKILLLKHFCVLIEILFFILFKPETGLTAKTQCCRLLPRNYKTRNINKWPRKPGAIRSWWNMTGICCERSL